MHIDPKEVAWLLNEKYGGVETTEYKTDLDRLAKGEPVAYVIGQQPFLDMKIFLDSRPLIPRPETEWWTEQLMSELKHQPFAEKRASKTVEPREGDFSAEEDTALFEATGGAKPLRFLDLCAGSGAIGCAALKYLLEAEVYFGEIDPAHEQTILKNIQENSLDASRSHVMLGDLFEPFDDLKFDIIACNPPYIPNNRTLEENVADHEPREALFAEEDGLGIIRRIADTLPQYLAPRGQAWIECDSSHATAAANLLTAKGLNCQIRSDQYEVPRLLVVSSE